ncbi:uncharacterized protein B0H18DRAFT_1117956 [Fomitopsis serialis]|uniref:uncharacterized protein n=1 Tax=Fomitopsis serialis TaxID=139415 RepID=UPI002007EFE0|nr:uncharacterized protein B0H18DRAFT_1117956 [Neoantrodia serialis]KAH9928271.1 hypothetical protein B0H18DRAFT_1117956 [Neoantrodia serialis]
MSLFSNILGGMAFGFAARVGQLAIQKRNIYDNLAGHAVSTAAFGFVGYWAYKWDERAAVLIAEKRAQIAARREAAAAAHS